MPGLNAREARERLERDGPNELVESRPPSIASAIVRQFSDVTVLALLAAAGVALALGWKERADETLLHRFGDAIAIGIILVLNAIVGFAQERKAERALRALKKLGAPMARVIRDGETLQIRARELVAGDCIVLSEGDRVPADGNLLDLDQLALDESALTGESTPVEKLMGELPSNTPLAERTNMIFMGTHVVRGGGQALVVATGMRTELGRIAALLGGVESPETPLQKSLRRFGRGVVIGCVLIGAIVFALGMLRFQMSLGFVLLTAVSLAVAAIPEGLPAITTIVLALGVQRMAKKNALIRRLAAVETLGSADVICTDKTGTLTQNRMAAREFFALDTPALARACEAALGNDPTDTALRGLATELTDARTEQPPDSLRVLSFDRQRKLATVMRSEQDGLTSYTHGAPEAVLGRTIRMLDERGSERPLDDALRAEIERRIDEWAAAGLRVIALARSRPTLSLDRAKLADHAELVATVERDLTLVGLVGLADPPRPEAKVSIQRARNAGVRSIMITGDHPRTAQAIGREIGLLEPGGEVITGPELDQLSDEELSNRIESVRIVARATAANKLRLVKALESRGHVVAMTGDGVNDAPAVKAASIGVAMGKSGTDVTREASDMVLLDDNYATIVSAIEEGRIVYGNIKRFLVFLFAVNAGLVIAVFVGALLGWPPLLTPTQILWINLITNGLPALALGMEPVQRDVLSLPPRKVDAPLLDRSELVWLLSYGLIMALLGLGAFAWHAHDLSVARTASFTVLAIGPLFHALSSRSRRDSLFTLGIFSNWRLIGAFGFALALQALALYVPILADVFGTTRLSLGELAKVLGLASLVWIAGELEKLVMKWRRDSSDTSRRPRGTGGPMPLRVDDR